MPLIDIEKEISKKTSDPNELSKLREAACLGLKAAIEDIERQISLAKQLKYKSIWISALEESLVYLKAMHHRAEKGGSTHPSTPITD